VVMARRRLGPDIAMQRTSDPFTSLVAISQWNFLRRSRAQCSPAGAVNCGRVTTRSQRRLLSQAVNLVIAPTPLVAANFILLGRIIRRLGPQYSRLTPRRYTIIFVSCDIISLLVQAMGGGIHRAQRRPDHKHNLI